MKLSGYSFPRRAAQLATIARKWEGRKEPRYKRTKKDRRIK
jgi:hypothetical protein